MPDCSKTLFYNDIADEFDSVMNSYDLQKRLSIVFEKLLRDEDLTNKRVLDAGCGTGWFSAAAWKRGGTVTALDIGPDLLRKVREKCPCRTVEGDLLRLPFPEEAFDVVICSEAVEHTRDPERAFMNLARVLRRDGCLVLTMPNRFWFWSVQVANWLKLRPYEGLENWRGLKDLRKWSDESGIRIEACLGFHLFPFVISWTQPLLNYLDRYGEKLLPVMVNIAVKGRKL